MSKESVYKTAEGATMLLVPKDPKYRKPYTKKVQHTQAKVNKANSESKLWRKLRPIVGFLVTPLYLIHLALRPVLRKLSDIGNNQFDKVFHSKDVNEAKNNRAKKTSESKGSKGARVRNSSDPNSNRGKNKTEKKTS